jgi:LysM domain
MTASAQSDNRLAVVSGSASREKAIPSGSRLIRLAAPTRPLSIPPAPIPPTAPVVPERLIAAPAHRLAPVPKMDEVAVAHSVAHSSIRWGRIGRLITAGIVTLTVVGALNWLGRTADPGIPARTSVIRVGAGETVWDVASRVAPQSDQRAVAERIQQLNGMVGTAVRPDQQLVVPDGR